MRMNWNPECPALLPTIVCYADILGFRNMTERALNSDKGSEFLRRIKGSLAAAYEDVRKTATLGGANHPIFYVKVFTDNIVVAYPLRNPSRNLGEPELGTLLSLFAHVQARLAADGFFLRGAISAGYHYQDQDIVFGGPLLEAVDLNEPGKPPRLVIGSSVESLVSEHLSWYGDGWAPHHHYLLEDPSDGRLFVNYLQAAFEHFPDGPVDNQLLAAHCKKVSGGLRKYEFDKRVGPKYMWIGTYHNHVLQTFANQFSLRLDEEAYPDEIAIGMEAQVVLDHLVPFETRPPNWSPRQLDAKRLQQRLSAALNPAERGGPQGSTRE